ncbi:MAG: hypothetical protein K2K57_09125 [Oscillospiraceae bacterium]|nr:hypothetical protein [Oscillospiraceae bacterium]
MTDTTPKAEKLRVFADFDMFNRDILMNVLEKHLQKGYMLKHSNQVIGLLTFEPVTAGDNVTYAVIRSAQYENGGILPKPWVKCGRMGDYIIWRSTSPAFIPKPDKDPAEWERRRRNGYIIQGIMWLLLFVMYLTTDIPGIFGSARGFSAYLDFRAVRDIVMGVNGVACLGMAFSKVKRDCTERGQLKYFKQYIEPYIIIVLIIGLLIFALADIKEKEIPLPDSRLPFSDEFDNSTCKLKHSYAAGWYIYSNDGEGNHLCCFLYEANFSGLAQKVFGEIRENRDVKGAYTIYPMPKYCFINYTVFEPLDASLYRNIDEILICDEDSDFYELTHKGLLVRSGDVIFGTSYDKENLSEKEILQYLDEFFA